MDQTAPTYGLIEWQAADGVHLAARIYGAGSADALPLVCLPGLTRNARDFEAVASHFASRTRQARAVLTFDYRGRGASAWGAPASYTSEQEVDDILAGLAFAGIDRAIFLGTSRGGIATMMIANRVPQMVAGAILNDIGPTVGMVGLARIVERMRAVAPMSDWEATARTISESYRNIYPAFGEAEWQRLARQFCREHEGCIVYDYDPDLVRMFDDFDPKTFRLDLWPLFNGMRGIPTMVIRGALSDLLSAATVEAMIRRHPGLEACVVPDQGHAPVLWERSVLERIARFLPG